MADTPIENTPSAQAEAGLEMEDGEQVETQEEFGELVKFTLAGFVGGLALGVLLDSWGLQLSAIGQWLVRTLSGEGESLLEGVYALRQRYRRARGTMAEAYGWGKVLGMTAPWVVDWGSRALGVDVYGVQGFYIPYLYSMSDQIGANLSGLVYLRRTDGSWGEALGHYARHPVLLASLVVVLLVPVGLLVARIGGFSPTTQTYTALEAIAANLCWVPPLVGAVRERLGRGPREP
ncbi:MAG TPA: hypothetical protein VJ714_08915 [Anaerolineae bacterium]|nr:hypothetical protein [Anaerolineae bacterium]